MRKEFHGDDECVSRGRADGRSVNLVTSPDKETTQQGHYNYLSEGINIDFAAVGEPTGLDVCPAARSHYNLFINY